MKQSVIIVGAGIIGLATAERLLLKGAKVTLLERRKAGQESSWAGGGILSPLCPWDYANEVTQLTDYSAKQFPSWISTLHNASGINPEYDKSGMWVLPPYNLDAARQWYLVRQMNFTPHPLTDTPFISNNINTQSYSNKAPDFALYLPEIAQIRNPRLLQALLKRVTLLGGHILENCTVENLKITHHKVQSINSACGKFVADYYIVCAGAWSKGILGAHRLKLNIKPIKGQMLLFKFDKPPIRTIAVQGDLYIIPRQDGHLLVGSTLENVGFNKQVTISARNYLLNRAQSILPELGNMPIIQHWSGLRPGSSNNIPTIGKHPIIDNLFINCGHFRYGVTMAPASAEILVNEIIDATQPLDIKPYQAGWNSD